MKEYQRKKIYSVTQHLVVLTRIQWFDSYRFIAL